MKKQHAWQIVLMFFCLFLPAGLAAQPLQKIVEEAKKEGKLLFYTVLSLPESQALI
ncbi:MAG: hypothetical protein HYY82_17285, partial [Deltaproteobacteria bacterium]|nr:hypothetical protein [Deltaproteobacteria bacterium]